MPGRKAKLELVTQKKENVPDGGTIERKGAVSLKFLASVWNTKDAIISRRTESA